MTAGRPPLFKNEKENFFDYSQIVNIFNKREFKIEKDLCDFIERNIVNFSRDVLNDKVLSYDRESYITNQNTPNSPSYKNICATGNKSKIDFKINCKEGIYLVECKNPTNIHRELNRAVAQILDYIIIAENGGLKVLGAWLVCTKINMSILNIIKRFNLPINVCLFSKNKGAIWVK